MLKRIINSFPIISIIGLSACAHGPNTPMGSGGHMTGYGYTGGVMWFILLLLFIVAFYYLYQGLKNRSDDASSQVESPLDILKRRYANGEIDKSQFDRMKGDLEK